MGRPVPNPFEDDRRVLSIAELQAREELEQRAAARGTRRATPPAYAELHAHSAFSFLDGASQPDELAARAAELGYEALALTHHDGVYGSPALLPAGKAGRAG